MSGFPHRWRDSEVVMRAQAAEMPMRLILGELLRRALAWVDGRWKR